MPDQPPSDDPQLPQLRRFRFDSSGSRVPREVPLDDVPPTSPEPPATPSRVIREPAPEAPAVARETPAEPSPTFPSAEVAEPADLPRRRSAMPSLIAGLAAAVALIALVAWLVLRPTADDSPSGTAGEKATEEPDLTVAAWADAVCSRLAAYETESLPLKAEAAKAATISPTTATALELQREAGTLLGGLADDLGEVGLPAAGEDVPAVHTELVSAVDDAIARTSPDAGGPAGSPRDRAGEVSEALAVPLSTFTSSVGKLPEEPLAEITGVPACQSVL